MAAAKPRKRAPKAPAWQPTAQEFAEAVKAQLADFMHNNLRATQDRKLGDEDGIMVTYASVPRGSSELDSLNAQTTPMFHVTRAKGHAWPYDTPMPAKVKIEMFRGPVRTVNDWKPEHRIKFRTKSATPTKILKYLVDFFNDNKAAFLPSK